MTGVNDHVWSRCHQLRNVSGGRLKLWDQKTQWLRQLDVFRSEISTQWGLSCSSRQSLMIETQNSSCPSYRFIYKSFMVILESSRTQFSWNCVVCESWEPGISVIPSLNLQIPAKQTFGRLHPFLQASAWQWQILLVWKRNICKEYDPFSTPEVKLILWKWCRRLYLHSWAARG